MGKPDGVDCGEKDGCRCYGSGGERSCELIEAEEGGGADHADEGAGSADDVAGEVPPGGEEDGGERGVGVGGGGLGDEGAGAEEVPGGGDVVAGLVPEVGEAEEGVVGEVDGYEEERVEHPERDVAAWLIAASSEESHAFSGRGRLAGGTAARARGRRRSARTGRGCCRGRSRGPWPAGG